MAESQNFTQLAEHFYDDPEQLSQLLQQRASSNPPIHFSTSSESRQSALTASAAPVGPEFAAELQPARIDHALSARRVSIAKHVPLLHTACSAPTSSGFVIDREAAQKMHHSFNMDVPGDTQPDSQMHKAYTSSIHATGADSSRLRSPRSLFVEQADEEDELSEEVEVEVVGSSQERRNPTNTSPTVVHEDDGIGPLPHHSYADTSPLKFETPAITLRRGDSHGQFLSSAARTNNTTPGTVASASAFQGFGNAGMGRISLTQAWNNTQAPTSPVAEDIAETAAEDAAFERPSPNFTNVRQSSPMPALSSPIKAIQPETPQTHPPLRSSSEPFTEYVSMKESQERRKRQQLAPPTLQHEDSWDLPSAAQVRQRRLKAKADFQRAAALDLGNVTAPISLSSPMGKARPGSGNSPRKARPGTRRQLSETAFNLQTPRWNTVNAPEEDDLLDDLHSVQVPNTSSHNLRIPPSPTASPSIQLRNESQRGEPPRVSRPREPSLPSSSKESVAITDSQPEATATYESIPRPKSLRYPSSPSTDQYSINQTTMATRTGYTSQGAPSSLPPMPPSASSEAGDVVGDQDANEEENETRVPSSPPLVAHEDDITYVEHEQTYDEYDEGHADEEIRESVEPPEPEETAEESTVNELRAIKSDPDHEEGSEEEEENEGDGHESANEDEEVDLVQPMKVDSETDDAALGSTTTYVTGQGEHEVSSATRLAMGPPRKQRQSTIPDTDALEETQPSFFPLEDPRAQGADDVEEMQNDAEQTNETNSTEPFHTAQEQQLGSQSRHSAPFSSRGEGSDTLQTGGRLRSMQDIYDLPNTQQSVGEKEIIMPHLSDLDENDPYQAQFSPARPAHKRRRITYTAKRNVLRTPSKGTPATVKELAHAGPPPTVEIEQSDDRNHPDQVMQENGGGQPGYPIDNVRDHTEVQVKAATLKSKAAPHQARPSRKKKGSLKPVPRELLKALSSPGNSPSKPKPPASACTAPPVTPAQKSPVKTRQQGDIDMPDQDDDRDELADTDAPAKPTTPSVERTPKHIDMPNDGVLLPTRVLASWPGSHYYPATCTGRATGRMLHVRYDDGNTTTLDSTHVRALDLRHGDQVKVNEPGMKIHTYIVVGFKDRIDDLAGEEFPTTDQRGYATIVVEEKQKASLPSSKTMQSKEPISVPMASIYITAQLWPKLRDRVFNFDQSDSPSKSTSRIGTPAGLAEMVATPSLFRKSITVPLLSRDATTRAGSVASSSAYSGSGTFSNMAFVLTSTAADVDKDTIARLIKSNGGRVLEDGFHELFDLATGGSPPSSSEQDESESGGSADLKLKPQFQGLGFVALITDSFSRSTKYIQALALNVPCLHLRWIQDSLNTSHAAPFAKYLLPAGVSKFLDPSGVVRSRTMTPYDPSADDISFARTVAARDFLLNNQSVLLITGKSKKEIEKRQPFVFLTHALGSAKVGRCVDLAAAKDRLATTQWDWVYVDSSEVSLVDAAAELFTSKRPAASAKPKKGGKKRKRDADEERENLVARGQVQGRVVKVTSSEFVVQSLILGALVEE